MIPLTAQQTLGRARAILETGRGAGLPELLKLIESLSLNICEVSIPELAELIEKDAVVLAKVIAVANTLGHNPGIAPTTTLSQAIHRLGYNRIRTVAVSLMLLESAGAGHPTVQRDAAALALCAGLAAHGAAADLGTHDPEFAFACAALRNFGRIVLASVSPEHSREAVKRTRKLSDAAAHRSVFGLTPIELSRELLTTARLPVEILETLRECEPAALAGVATTHRARLLGIADYGSRLAALVLGTHESPEAFVAKSTALGRQFESLLPGAVDLARPALRHADERLGEFGRCLGTRGLPTASLQRVRLRRRQLTPDESAATPTATPTIALPTAMSNGVSPAAHDTAAAPDGATPVAAPQEADTPLHDFVDAETAALTLVGHALDAEECWLFLPEGEGRRMTLTAGIGAAWQRFQPDAIITATERSVFGVALARREVVLIHDTRDIKIAAYLPDWWHEPARDIHAFCLIPVEIGGTVKAVILGGWHQPRRIVLAPENVNAVRERTVALVGSPAPAAA